MNSSDHLGKVIGKYRLISALGEGGMGAVYLAEHQTIGRQAAVKVLRPELAVQPEVVARFLNEARATNRIKHPSIVDIYDCDQHPEVGVYLVMELLEGTSLERFCRPESRLPVPEVIEILTQVAGALAEAHRNDIVHRDLKPANVFLVDDAGGRRAKVLDFGIAKLMGGGSGVQTRTGSLVGTPAYMSPEQCHGARSVDHRTDIYALGVIAYELLAGRPPFVADGYGALIAMHLSKDPPPLRDVAPQVSEDLESVVLQCLAKDPEERFASMDALATALRRAGESVPAVPPTLMASGPIPATMVAPGPTLPPVETPAPSRSTRAPAAAPSTPTPPIADTTVPGQGQAPITRPPQTGKRWPIFAAVGVGAIVVALGGGYGAYRYWSAPTPTSPAATPPVTTAAGRALPDAGVKLASHVLPEGSSGVDSGAGTDAASASTPGGTDAPCRPARWDGPPAEPLRLRRVGGKRGNNLIVDFRLSDVLQDRGVAGSGGLGRKNDLAWNLRGCSDSPDRRFAPKGAGYTDPTTGLRFEITAVEPAGRTGRGWRGVTCSFRISDPQDPRLYVDLDGSAVPAHNELNAALRDGPMVFATLQFNGYAREVGGKGNVVLGLDLCQHRVVWRSRDMISNGPILARGDYLITGYGFTAEPDFMYVLDRGTGKVVGRATLPKSPEELRLVGDDLYVKIYDGYQVFRLEPGSGSRRD